jgi:hypothetical protein
MKLKSLLCVVCLGLWSSLFATNLHLNPKATEQKPGAKSMFPIPSSCQIEIINDSNTDIYVYGTFDDHSRTNFTVYWRDPPHYISLFYYFYCHSGMYLDVLSPYQLLFSGWLEVDRTLHIISYPLRGMKAESGAKVLVVPR